MGIRTEYERFPFVAVGKKIDRANSILPRNMQWSLYIIILVSFDMLMTMLAFWLAYYIRFRNPAGIFDETGTISLDRYRFLLYFTPLLWAGIFSFNGLYNQENLLGGTREYSSVFRSASEGFLVIVIAGFLDPTLIIARGWLLMAWIFSIMLVMISRFSLRRMIYSLRKQG